MLLAGGAGSRFLNRAMVFIWLALCLRAVVCFFPAAAQASSLTVAYAVEGDLYLWQEGDAAPRRLASGTVLRPHLSPDGTFVAFVRGEAQAASLWLVNGDGSGETELVGAGDLPTDTYLGQVEWGGADTLYFNTVRQDALGLVAQNDLYRVDLSATVIQLLPPGEGGAFTLNPSGNRLALVLPGAYRQTEGRIRVFEVASGEMVDLLTFPAVASGSHEPFYPAVQWVDENLLLTAVPPPDLLYEELSAAPSPVALWRLNAVTGERVQMGEVQASLFGLPRWSDDGAWMTWLQRNRDRSGDGGFRGMVAEGDGQNATAVIEHGDETLRAAQWIPGQNRYLLVNDGAFWLGAPGESLTRWHAVESEVFLSPEITSSHAVYGAMVDDRVELNALPLDVQAAPTRIAALDTIPLIDVINRIQSN
ncbi:MAG: hypothetical protein SF029_00795 [bacterium]|nr:hypothetical protein [bacterium]